MLFGPLFVENGFCAGGGERLHEVSLGAKMVADKGASLLASMHQER